MQIFIYSSSLLVVIKTYEFCSLEHSNITVKK